ncbi:hypothetical protein Poly30_14150 [Planctomycetes bacterium Poly30]|uniref:DUF7305 domain-containing protein n=1 Tax=Saltatorellus ferox TaxID=2528018 RepID=A0A518EPA4_9BACT|nr:hypothetical protein Poly30_14150 [Planctomycetes bacterium Poly30]
MQARIRAAEGEGHGAGARRVEVHGTRAGTAPPGKRAGFALVLALILVTVVSGLCIGFVQLAAKTSKAQTGSVDQMRAFYLAEAGLAEAFHAVRMGRSGRIASANNAASYGDGLLWVESAETPDRKVWLRATATVGGGRAMLGLIVEPEEPPLGFFADEEIIIESTLLADGFDSTDRSYDEEIAAIAAQLLGEPPSPVAPFVLDDSVHRPAQIAANRYADVLTPEGLLAVLSKQVTLRDQEVGDPIWTLKAQPTNPESPLGPVEYLAFLDDLLILKQASDAGALLVDPLSAPSAAAGPGPTSGTAPGEPPQHTLSGGVLGSNGNITFADATAAVAVFGSLQPGVNGQVTGLDTATISGSTTPRAMQAQVHPVEIPNLGDAVDLTHSSAIPRVVPPGDMRIGTFSAAAGSDVIVRGPARLVVHDLTLEGGSTLTLDTRDGDVELFVTGSILMDPASFVETTGASSKEVSIQAAPEFAGDPGPPLQLDATSRFHGTVYAPGSTVHLGGNFEVFGGVVAQRLEIGAGARLHFDDESYRGVLAVPEQDTWQILDLPAPTERPATGLASLGVQIGGANAAPHPPLGAAHRLDDVALSIRYLDASGLEQRYAGPESAFDWSDVASIEAQDRMAARMQIVEQAGETAPADPSAGQEDWDWDATFQDQVEDVIDWFANQDPAGATGETSPVAITKKQADAAAKAAKDAQKKADKAVEAAVKAAEKAAKAAEKAAKAAEKAAAAAAEDPTSKDAAEAAEKAAKEEQKAADKAADQSAADARAAVASAAAAAAAAEAAAAKALLAAQAAGLVP